MSNPIKSTAEREPVPLHGLVRIPVLLWAEIGGERIEMIKDVTVSIGAGHCPILAREIFAKQMAKTLADLVIKTGWEFCNPNAIGEAQPPAKKL